MQLKNLFSKFICWIDINPVCIHNDSKDDRTNISRITNLKCIYINKKQTLEA